MPAEQLIVSRRLNGLPRTAVAVDRASLAALELRTREAAQRTLLAPTVTSPRAWRLRPSELDAWLKAGLAAAGFSLAFAALLLIVDTVLRARASALVLASLGMAQSTNARLERALFALPFWTIGGLSAMVGLFFAVLFARVAGLDLPGAWLGAVVATAAGAGVVGAAAVGRFSVSSGSGPGARSASNP